MGAKKNLVRRSTAALCVTWYQGTEGRKKDAGRFERKRRRMQTPEDNDLTKRKKRDRFERGQSRAKNWGEQVKKGKFDRRGRLVSHRGGESMPTRSAKKQTCKSNWEGKEKSAV